MERKINKLEHSHVEVNVTVDKESWKKAQKKAFEKEAAKVEVKGFRKGKAPLNMVKDRVNMEAVFNEAINSLLPEIYQEIMEQDKIEPYTRPQIDVTKISEDELEVKFTIVTAPEVELGNYKGLKVGKVEAKVTEEDVNNEVNNLLSNSASLILKEGVAALGDTLVFDFVGTVNGEKFEGGSAENYELVLGSHSFIPGFEEQLVGHGSGEHVDVNVTFPENYTEELKGKPAVFACDIHEVKEKKLPELNDDFAKEQGIEGVENVGQLKEHLKNKKLQEVTKKNKEEYLNKLLEEIAKGSKIDIPDEILESQTQSRKSDFINKMGQSGLTYEQYLSIIGQTEEQFLAQLKETAAKEFTNYLVLTEVASKEGFDVTDADIDFEVAKLADQYKMKEEDVRKAIANQMNDFKHNIKMMRVENFLFENND